ncbi:unnamed protein product [Didymodactylos carnosus]|uniref:Ubiquitin fusion degradaton protein n=1 Tax=Didymodactylos carnosus TaxID=1234261 RepID=A0A814SHJ9_9BILA|nr:unnamed protein product [Didymodactylos carnosus]CAF1147505.1 unnamed protein product [Didymodactylos carnosus]CAF3883051.1 unnamed protein product [Didymodactylos carnosus]CAF3911117.1 unnamed protein product [Didymodactylos carnosus]
MNLLFNPQLFHQHLARMGGMGGVGTFRALYNCYSAIFLTDRERPNVENGGKILLPQVALEQLAEHVTNVMLFKLKNKRLDRITHVGVFEFLPNDENSCYVPSWIMRHLLLEEGEEVECEYVTLPTASFVRFQPQSKDFLDISNPKAVLETALRNFSCLTKGDMLAINYLDRNYELCVLELKPADAVTIIECDMEVDFAPPIDYVEPKYDTTASSSSSIPKSYDTSIQGGTNMEQQYPNSLKSTTFMPFHGRGNRLDGKTKTKEGHELTEQQTKLQAAQMMNQQRAIPNYDYEYGTLQFMHNRLKKNKDDDKDSQQQQNSSTNQVFTPFSGEGNILKQPKQQRKP